VRRGSDDPADRVASTAASVLLPTPLPEGSPRGAVTVADALALGDRRWLLVLHVGDELFTSAVVEAEDAFRRAGPGDGVAEALLTRTARGGEAGRFSFRRLGEIGSWTGERAIEVDQSNESIVVGEKAVMKRSVRTAPDNRRPMLLPAHLSEAGFAEMPTPLGTLGWRHEGGVAPLASMAAYLPDARDGWEWYVEIVDRSIEDPSVDAIAPAAALGALTARLHVCLATPTEVLPGPRAAAANETVAGWGRDAEHDLGFALTAIDGEEGERLRRAARSIREELARLPVRPTTTIPIHGDLHVGQFLRWRDGLAVSDLDGDPLGSGALGGPPAKDVASLVQSLDHVGRIVERRRGVSVGAWIADASEQCLRSYRDELALRDASSLFDEELLRPLRVAQELHEFVYSATYLPRWRYVPDRALASLLSESA
jgi:maltokinase